MEEKEKSGINMKTKVNNIFDKEYFLKKLRDAGGIKSRTVKGVVQMCLLKVPNVAVGLVLAASTIFPIQAVLKWIRTGKKMTPEIERQFKLFAQLYAYLRDSVQPDDVEEWKIILNETKYTLPAKNDTGWASIFQKVPDLCMKVTEHSSKVVKSNTNSYNSPGKDNIKVIKEGKNQEILIDLDRKLDIGTSSSTIDHNIKKEKYDKSKQQTEMCLAQSKSDQQGNKSDVKQITEHVKRGKGQDKMIGLDRKLSIKTCSSTIKDNMKKEKYKKSQPETEILLVHCDNDQTSNSEINFEKDPLQLHEEKNKESRSVVNDDENEEDTEFEALFDQAIDQIAESLEENTSKYVENAIETEENQTIDQVSEKTSEYVENTIENKVDQDGEAIFDVEALITEELDYDMLSNHEEGNNIQDDDTMEDMHKEKDEYMDFSENSDLEDGTQITDTIEDKVLLKDQEHQDGGLMVSSGSQLDGSSCKTPDPAVVDEKESRTVFLKNLAFNVTEEDIRKVFNDCGKVENIYMKRNKRTGKLFCILVFKSIHSALEALTTKDGNLIKGRPLNVNAYELGGCESMFKTEVVEKKKLFVKGLPFSFNEEDVKNVFLQHGPIKDIKIIYKNGYSKGLCYIDYYDETTAAKVLKAMDGVQLENMTLIVQYCRPHVREPEVQKNSLGSSKPPVEQQSSLKRVHTDNSTEIIDSTKRIKLDNKIQINALTVLYKRFHEKMKFVESISAKLNVDVLEYQCMVKIEGKIYGKAVGKTRKEAKIKAADATVQDLKQNSPTELMCRFFNEEIGCQKRKICRFLHRCYKCFDEHPTFECKVNCINDETIDDPEDIPELKEKLDRGIITKNSSETSLNSELICTLCGITIFGSNSSKVMLDHLAGKKHKSNMNDNPENVPELQEKLDSGIITKISRGPGLDYQLFCTVCNISLNHNRDMREHLSGKKHKSKMDNSPNESVCVFFNEKVGCKNRSCLLLHQCSECFNEHPKFECRKNKSMNDKTKNSPNESICKFFNKKVGCKNLSCLLLHKCLECFNEHPKFECRKNKSINDKDKKSQTESVCKFFNEKVGCKNRSCLSLHKCLECFDDHPNFECRKNKPIKVISKTKETKKSQTESVCKFFNEKVGCKNRSCLSLHKCSECFDNHPNFECRKNKPIKVTSKTKEIKNSQTESVCKFFNEKMGCKNRSCLLLHKCSECFDEHPNYECRKNKPIKVTSKTKETKDNLCVKTEIKEAIESGIVYQLNDNVYHCSICKVDKLGLQVLLWHLEGEQHKNKVNKINVNAELTEIIRSGNKAFNGELKHIKKKGSNTICMICNVKIYKIKNHFEHPVHKLKFKKYNNPEASTATSVFPIKSEESIVFKSKTSLSDGKKNFLKSSSEIPSSDNVEKIPNDDKASVSDDIEGLKDFTETIPSGTAAIVIKSCRNSLEGYLDIRKGDRLTILEVNSEGMCKGVNASGFYGNFPRSHIRLWGKAYEVKHKISNCKYYNSKTPCRFPNNCYRPHRCNKCQGEHSVTNCPLDVVNVQVASEVTPQTEKKLCRYFNGKTGCLNSSCIWAHRCSKCNGHHSAIACQDKTGKESITSVKKDDLIEKKEIQEALQNGIVHFLHDNVYHCNVCNVNKLGLQVLLWHLESLQHTENLKEIDVMAELREIFASESIALKDELKHIKMEGANTLCTLCNVKIYKLKYHLESHLDTTTTVSSSEISSSDADKKFSNDSQVSVSDDKKMSKSASSKLASPYGASTSSADRTISTVITTGITKKKVCLGNQQRQRKHKF